jgi:DNA processing protein
MAALAERERLDRLRLIRSENIGPVTFRRLMARYARAAEALDALPALSRRGGRRGAVAICSHDRAEAELDAAAALGGRHVIWGDPDYPALLAQIEDAPPAFTVLGDAALLSRRAVAVVGARNASANGRRFARTIARDLGEAGLVVVSGMARGIDGAAHEGALASGTVAVLAGGADNIYPPEHAALHAAIRERGAILAEQPPGTVPQARHFPFRNRIIAGLSLGTVVVEAAKRSGSLITARLAGDQGREVFAVPGSPLDPRCGGTNDLIRQGAVLTESAADVLDSLPGGSVREMPGRAPDELTEAAFENGDSGLDDARAKVVEALGPAPVPVDEIVRQCHLSPSVVSTVLLELELAGRLERHPGNQVSGA